MATIRVFCGGKFALFPLKLPSGLLELNRLIPSSQALFGVFDGHGGKNAAEFAAENMPKFIAEEFKKVNGGEIEGAVKRGYLKTDEEFLKRDESGGACCVTAVLQKGGLVVSNAGDCRAVLSRAGKAEALTSDHRASREDEKERIENLVCPRCPNLLISCTNSANAIENALKLKQLYD